LLLIQLPPLLQGTPVRHSSISDKTIPLFHDLMKARRRNKCKDVNYIEWVNIWSVIIYVFEMADQMHWRSKYPLSTGHTLRDPLFPDQIKGTNRC
jgi:hypothetical protein